MAKQTHRGSEISVTIPTEPMAGRAKNVPVMEVRVMDEGALVLEYKIPEGQAISFRIGGDHSGLDATHGCSGARRGYAFGRRDRPTKNR